MNSRLCPEPPFGAIVLLALCSGLCPTGYAAGPDDVDYRQNVMKTLGAQVEAMEMVLQGRAPANDLEHHLAALATTSSQVLPAFEPAASGGNAKAAVWDDWDDFSKRAREQADGLAALRDASASAEFSSDRVREALHCNGCHDAYRLDTEGSVLETGDDPGQDAVVYRRTLMRAMDAQTAAVGQILAWMVADRNFVFHLEAIAANARMSAGAFEPAVAGGESLPRVWTDREDFAVRMQALADGVGQTAETARQLGKDAALVPLMDALTCDQCHDQYRRSE